MFNYFRAHAPHRRNGSGSTPASPHSPQWDSPSRLNWPETVPGLSPVSHGYDSPISDSPVSLVPPQLPPIPRIASRTERPAGDTSRVFRPDPSSANNTSGTSFYARAQPHRRTDSVPAITRTSTAGDIYQQVDGQFGSVSTSATSNDGPSMSWTTTQRPRTATDAPSAALDPSPVFTHYPAETATSLASSRTTNRSSSNLAEESQQSYLPLTNHISQSPTSLHSQHRKSPSSSNVVEESQQTSPRTAQPVQEAQSKPHRAKLNLLNPMNLLTRRRTSHSGESLQDTSFPIHRASAVPAMSLPDDYDPRIKGSGVHDFSAPRTRRHPSTSEAEAAIAIPPRDQYDSQITADPAPRRTHQPIFVEHFDDEETRVHDPSAIHRESLANTEFVKRMSRQLDNDSTSDVDQQRRTPSPAEHTAVTPRTAERTSKETISTAHRESTDRSTVHSSHSHDTRDTSPTGSLSRSRSSRASPGPDLSFTNLPNHMTSNASRTSRFSFQQTESSLAQEKALEEKHKQKASHEASSGNGRFDENDEDETQSMYDDYEFDDDDGDDDIPYIGDDADAYSTSNRISIPLNQPSGPTIMHQHSLDTSPTQHHDLGEEKQLEVNGSTLSQPSNQERSGTAAFESATDDLYFDDGMIEDEVAMASSDRNGDFDESVFDSMAHDSRYDVGRNRKLPADLQDSRFLSEPGESSSDDGAITSKIPELTVTNEPLTTNDTPSTVAANRLNAYHSALASAANKAAETGKFSRKASIGESLSEDGSGPAQRAESPAEDTAGRRNVYDYLEEGTFSFDDYDTDLEEDPMIAAANAEVLATEDAEFYGQEFGFYGGSSGSGEMFNGGFFGTNNSNTGNAVREPNLTPITERSEYSTRNSFVSIAGHGSSAALAGIPGSATWSDGATGPGLKDLMGHDEDNMTLGQLMKLRREAFGGAGNRGSFTAVSTGSSPTHSSGSPMHLMPGSAKHSPQTSQSSAGAIDPDMTPRRPDTTRTHGSSGEDWAGEDAVDEYGYSSSSSPALRQAQFGHRATPSTSELREPSQSATRRNTPLSVPASSSKPQNTPRTPSTVTRKPVSAAPMADVPILLAPRPQSKRTSVPGVLSGPSPVSPLTSPELGTSKTTSSFPSPPSPMSPVPTSNTTMVAMPFPPADVLQKHATRPTPDASRQIPNQAPSAAPSESRQDSATTAPVKAAAGAQHHRRNGGGSVDRARDSVAYVLEGADPYNSQQVNGNGNGTWYLERRRTMDTGEVVVIGREPVEGGRI